MVSNWSLWCRLRQAGTDFMPQNGQHPLLEPGVLAQPGIVSPGWMRHRNDQGTRRIAIRHFPVPDRLRQRRGTGGTHMPLLRILADEYQQVDAGQEREKPVAPGRGTFPAWRQVAALVIQARKAEPHRNYGDARGVVELGIAYAHPLAQALARRVRERPAGRMHPRAGGLAANADARTGLNLQNGPGLVRQRPAPRIVHA